ncbi:RNA polymerase sigma-70 factor [Snuella lapsa]|uniref:RNA polymerase sigma-70 factor n=2 Tax=Snuella lapsa TaxID=870481 RepID=A0ABP6YBT5_9FLAO
MMDSKILSDKKLMERIKHSDHKAFELLYDRFWEEMYVKAYAILKDKSKSKDIVQEVWISIWEKRHKIENNNIQGYLFTALRFRIYNEFRNSKNKEALIDDFINSLKTNDVSNNIDNDINLKETQEILYASIEKLPKKCKEVFRLSRFEGLKNSEIAKKLDISQRTVETHISNALKILKNDAALNLAIFIAIFLKT